MPGARVVETYERLRGINLRNVHYQLLSGLPVSLVEKAGPYAAYYCPMKTHPGRIARVFEPPFSCCYSGEWNPAWMARTDTAKTMAMADCLGWFIAESSDADALRAELEKLWSFRAYEIAEREISE